MDEFWWSYEVETEVQFWIMGFALNFANSSKHHIPNSMNMYFLIDMQRTFLYPKHAVFDSSGESIK